MGRTRWSKDDMRMLEYLFMLSCKHEVDFKKFVEAIADAQRLNQAKCGGLTIKCRTKNREEGVFIIMAGRRLVAQVRLEERILKRMLEQGHPQSLRLSRHWGNAKKSRKVGDVHIADLHIGMKGVSLEARVIEKSLSRRVYSRFTSSPLKVAVIIAEDSTGSIQLNLWNEQIDSVSVGDRIQIENVRVGRYKGTKQLLFNKRHSKLSVIE